MRSLSSLSLPYTCLFHSFTHTFNPSILHSHNHLFIHFISSFVFHSFTRSFIIHSFILSYTLSIFLKHPFIPSFPPSHLLCHSHPISRSHLLSHSFNLTHFFHSLTSSTHSLLPLTCSPPSTPGFPSHIGPTV